MGEKEFPGLYSGIRDSGVKCFQQVKEKVRACAWLHTWPTEMSIIRLDPEGSAEGQVTGPVLGRITPTGNYPARQGQPNPTLTLFLSTRLLRPSGVLTPAPLAPPCTPAGGEHPSNEHSTHDFNAPVLPHRIRPTAWTWRGRQRAVLWRRPSLPLWISSLPRAPREPRQQAHR